jgi:tetratricopeptide (TPR) repeat protein
MALDVLAWALGAILTSAWESVLESIFSKDLSSKLNAAVLQWSRELSSEITIVPEALFQGLPQHATDAFPHLRKLRKEFEEFRIPSQEIWFKALYERWTFVKSLHPEHEIQDFFRLDADSIRPHLQKLAAILETTCKKDSDLFRTTSINMTEEVLGKVADIQGKVTDIYAAIEPSAGATADPLVVAWRNELHRLGNMLSGTQEKELERYRELYRQGAYEEAYRNVNELYKSDFFPQLQNDLKAKIVRILATYTLNLRDEFEAAEDLLNEAVILDPSADYSVSYALLEYRKENPDGALEILKHPSDIDAFNFRLSLLLEQGDKRSFLVELSQCEFDVNAETMRLKALGDLFFNKDIAAALLNIESALLEKSSWESIQVACGIINYFGALSPALIPDQMIQFPEPAPWALIKQDGESITRLENAAMQFESLAARVSRDDSRWLAFMIWKLSCVATHAGRQDDAQELARQLLKEDLSDVRIISWIIARGYDVDLGPSVDSLTKSGDDVVVHLDKVVALVNIYYERGDVPPALELLEKSKSSFLENNAKDLWHYWYASILIRKKEYDRALAVSQDIEHYYVKLFIKTQAMRAKAGESKEWSEFIKHLEDAYRESSEEGYLLEACQLNAYLGKWEYVSSRSDELLGLLRTPTVVELAVKAAWHVDPPKKCLKVIRDHSHIFYGGILTPDVARIKVYCQMKVGAIPEALIDAEENYKNDRSTDNLLLLLETQARIGDLTSLSLTARELLKRNDVPPKPLLNVARLVIAENRTLARQLWRKSLAQAQDEPDLIGAAVDIGYRLNMERELQSLVGKMMEYADQGVGNIKAMKLDDLLKFIETNRENNALLKGKYDRAEVPIHMIPEEIGVPLTRFYAGFSQGNALTPDPYNQPIILSRHGSRNIDGSFSRSAPDWRLNIDITALLTAQHLELLDDIEKCFSIRIAPSLQAALLYEKGKLSYHQPSQVAAHKKVIDLFHRGALMELPVPDTDIANLVTLADKMGEEWVRLLEYAKIEGAFIVDVTPLKSRGSRSELVDLTASYRNCIVNCTALLNALKAEGRIAGSTYKSVLSDLGEYGTAPPSGCAPPISSNIIITDAVLHMLAATEALEIICSNYTVRVLHSCINESKAFLREIDDRNRVIEKIDSLLQRVADGLKSGLYEMIPVRNVDTGSEDGQSPIVSTVVELWRGIYDKGDIVWIDDRFANSYVRVNIAPIVSAYEILLALRELTIISEDEFFEKLLKLRTSNFRYIPCSREEIIYYLNRAGLENGSVRDTYELNILKRYFACCLLDDNRLQRPPMPRGAPSSDGEVMFFVTAVKATLEAISYWWEQDAEDAETYADWIFVNLYTGLYGIRHLRGGDDGSSEGLNLVALDIASAFMQSVSMIGESKALRRKKYFAWAEQRLLNKRLRINPEIAGAVSKIMEIFLKNENLNALDKKLRTATQLLLQDFYSSLPDSLQSELSSSESVMNAIGLKTIESIVVEGMSYRADQFWSAVNKALKGEEGVINDLQTRGTYYISRRDEDDGSFFLEIKGDAKEVGLRDPIVRAVSDDPGNRRELLLLNRNWFDVDTEELREVVNEITSTERLADRIKKIESWRSSSASYQYEKIQNRIVAGEPLTYEDLAPIPSGLLRHFRLERGGNVNFAERISESAQRLLSSEGLEVVLERLSKLPTEMPEDVIEQFKALAPDRRQKLLAEYCASWASPVCKLHLLNLSLISGDIGLARSITEEAFSEDGKTSFELFRAMLNWTNTWIEGSPDTNGWDSSVKLAIAWAHSSYLYNMFHLGKAEPESLTVTFASVSGPVANEVFKRDSLKWNDIIHPNRVNRALILVGLGKIISTCDEKVISQLGVKRTFMDYLQKDEEVSEFLICSDPLLMNDNLDSLFGGDRSINLSFLPHDIARQISSIYLKDIVASALSKIRAGQGAPLEWLQLSLILGDLPCYRDLLGELQDILLNIDFGTMLVENHQAALLALRVGAKQAKYVMSVDVGRHIENGLLYAASFFFEKPDLDLAPFTVEQISIGLIDDALSLSIIEDSDTDISSKFARLTQGIWERWPGTSEYMKAGIFRLTQELPASLLHGLWKLILFGRAN